MKKKLSILLVLATIFSFGTTFSQKKSNAFVKFSVDPPKKISIPNISEVDFFVEYKTKKEATIYLELRKNDKPVGNAIQTIKSKKPKIVKLNINLFGKKTLVAGSGYTYQLYMFEGPKNTWTQQLGVSSTIDGIKLSRL